MDQKTRLDIERAEGMIEAILWIVPSGAKEALTVALETIAGALKEIDNEEQEEEMENWRGIYTLCPFYHGETERAVQCEGVPRNSSQTICFPSLEQKLSYKKAYCEAEYKKCEYAELLYKKWDK